MIDPILHFISMAVLVFLAINAKRESLAVLNDVRLLVKHQGRLSKFYRFAYYFCLAGLVLNAAVLVIRL